MQQFKLIAILLFIFSFSCNNTNRGGEMGNGDSAIDKTNKDDIPIKADTTLIGEALSKWRNGYLDIDAINTGRGESTFIIFPDGTTMLVDAAGSLISPTNSIPPPPQKPNASVSPGQTIVDFINHFMPKDDDTLDYILLSHFHPDHMGGYSTSLPLGPDGNFRMGGVTEVGAKIPFNVIIDRGYPDYSYPNDLTADNSVARTADAVKNYIRFINWAKKAYNSKAEQFEVGSDQITLRKDPSKYDNFEIRNIVANGKVWTGEGSNWTNTFPENVNELIAANPNENIFSDGFRLSYGKFDYFSAGDLQYNGKSTYPWKDIETAVSKVMNPVDVMKADHHGTKNTDGEALVNKLHPQAVLVNVWRDIQPNPATIARFYAANPSCNIFLTNLSEANKERLSEYVSRIRSTNGHVVVRVAPGGSEYMVYVLDDTNEKYEVKKIFGPYTSK